MIFITRHLTGLIASAVPLPDLHVAMQEVDDTITKHDKTPLCHAGSINLSHWKRTEVPTEILHSSHVCGTCLKRLRARGIDVAFKDTQKAEHVQ